MKKYLVLLAAGALFSSCGLVPDISLKNPFGLNGKSFTFIRPVVEAPVLTVAAIDVTPVEHEMTITGTLPSVNFTDLPSIDTKGLAPNAMTVCYDFDLVVTVKETFSGTVTFSKTSANLVFDDGVNGPATAAGELSNLSVASATATTLTGSGKNLCLTTKDTLKLINILKTAPTPNTISGDGTMTVATTGDISDVESVTITLKNEVLYIKL